MAVRIRYGTRERKEVMCSVRTQSLHHLAGDGRLTGLPSGWKLQTNAGPRGPAFVRPEAHHHVTGHADSIR